ncbi:MAG: hypothetical protein M0Z60_02755 [Nitrospiraceae bacterium]|nr:hypothetical protein [Nitrospiraceae bacterium]
MSGQSNIFGRAFRFLASKELAAVLLILLCVALIPRTLRETEEISLGLLPRILFGCLALNLVFCTVRRARSFSKAVLVIHIGTIVTLTGAVISSYGFVSTVNVYEGTSVNSAYRWDLKRETPLGFKLGLRKVHVEYYPVPVKVGVLRGNEKVALFELKTGQDFRLDRYTVAADSIEFPAENLHLVVTNGGERIGDAWTGGERNLPSGFPYSFELVAFKDPAMKRVWVDLTLTKGDRVVEGTSAVNSPLTWEKLNFYNTSLDADRYGNRFAGIQITYDPGKPFVYWGFAVIGLGSGMYFVRKVYGKR